MTTEQAQAILIWLPYDIGGPKPTFAGIPRQMEILFIRIQPDTGLIGYLIRGWKADISCTLANISKVCSLKIDASATCKNIIGISHSHYGS